MSFQTGQPIIQGYDTVPLSAEVVEGGTWDELVTAAIQKSILNAGLQGKLASIAIPNSEVVSRIFSFGQSLKAVEIEAFIKIEVENNPPFPLQKVYWDFKILGSSLNDPGLQEVQVVVCPIDKVNARIAVVQRAGLTVQAVDLESLALERCRQWLAKTWLLEEKDGDLMAIAEDLKLAYSETASVSRDRATPSLGIACGLALRQASGTD
jgi:type IV pilus assembly protein PilM